MSPTLYLIGDSIAVHYGPYLRTFLEPSWQCRLPPGRDEALQNLDHPTGANGGDSRRLLQLITSITAEETSSCGWLAFNCGLHDIRRSHKDSEAQVPLAEYRENLDSMTARLLASPWKPIWITTTPVDDSIHNDLHPVDFQRFHQDELAYREAALTLMQSKDIAICDLGAFTAGFGQEAYCDHVHYRADFRRLQAAYLAGWLQGHVF